jgi:hypothetical protein
MRFFLLIPLGFVSWVLGLATALLVILGILSSCQGKDLAGVLLREVGTVETPTGSNDGPRIREYLRAAGIQHPAPWCAAFVLWGGKESGRPMRPGTTAWVPSWNRGPDVPPARNIQGLIWFPSLGRHAHVFVVVERLGVRTVRTVEGNTNEQAGREGDRVAVRVRPVAGVRFVDRRGS